MTPAQVAHIMPPLPKPLTLSRGDEDGAIQLGYTAEQMQAYARAAVEAALRDAPQAEPKRCPYCDDTGDVHSIDGQWRGPCNCPAGKPQQAEGWVMVPVEPTNEMVFEGAQSGEVLDYDLAARIYRAMLAARPSAPTAVEPDAPLKWCSYCGEGVTTFCRGKQSPDWDYKCPVLNLPARASKGTP